MSRYTESQAIRVLSSKHDIKITDKTIVVESNLDKRVNDLGNRSWGKIDFLVNYCRYSMVMGSVR